MLKKEYKNNYQKGLTLIELMIALTLAILGVFLCVKVIIGNSLGAKQVDNETELLDRATHIRDLMQKLILQTGYINSTDVINLNNNYYLELYKGSKPLGFPIDSFVFGCDSLNFSNQINNDNLCSSGTAGKNDVLFIRFNSESNLADRVLLDCSGNKAQTGSTTIVFNIEDNQLYCRNHRYQTSGSYQGSIAWDTYKRSLIQGVESFQVKYCLNNKLKTSISVEVSVPNFMLDGVARVCLTAKEINDASSISQVRIANWNSVVSIRIGLVLSHEDLSGIKLDEYSEKFAVLNGTKLYGYYVDDGLPNYDSADSIYEAPNDGKSRIGLSFTTTLRNYFKVNN